MTERAIRLSLIIALVGMIATPFTAQAQDIAEGRDHPLVGRYDGSFLKFYAERDYEEQLIPVKPVMSVDIISRGKKRNDLNSVSAAGRTYRLYYEGPAGRSPLEVVRNFEEKLAGQGFEKLFSCRGAECGSIEGAQLFAALKEESIMGDPGMHSNPGSAVYLVARKAASADMGEVTVAIYTSDFGGKGGNPGTPETIVDVIEGAAMQTGQIVFVDAEAMRKAIDDSGRVALYGIQFDFDKADIKPESQVTLAEIAKFLNSNQDVNLVVTGHTDAKGDFDYNLDLSQKRAAAVVKALTGQHGIAAARLTPFGAGMAAPIASNDDEAGRTKNRRVELVKR